MFKLPTNLGYQTLRNAFSNHAYKRIMMRLPHMRQAACRKGLFARLGMQVQ